MPITFCKHCIYASPIARCRRKYCWLQQNEDFQILNGINESADELTQQAFRSNVGPVYMMMNPDTSSVRDFL